MNLFSQDAIAVSNIWAEARGEPYPGKIAIGEVMRNRMKHKYSSNGTISDTVFRPYQFSGFNTDNPWRYDIFNINDSDPIVRDCINAWIDSARTNLACGAVLYCNWSLVQPSWATYEDLVATIGNHSFFLPQELRKQTMI